MVGDGPLKKDLEALAVDLGLSRTISFAGVKNDSEMTRAYAASDLVVLPSLSEGLPIVLLEAMASGRPVVATRVGGIPELVTSGKNGYLVTPGSADEIADRVIELLGRPELAAEMGAASRALVESTHSWDAVSSRVSSVYESVLGKVMR
jgi:glycosyltransferase involved in cell wall biosynthesis